MLRLSLPLSLILTLLLGCSQKNASEKAQNPVPNDPIVYSEAHIPFEKAGRNTTCCRAEGTKIAIATGGSHSAKCGKHVHDQGGNIVDAAVAVSFCLAVERPFSAGLGGGGFMTLHLSAPNSQDVFVDFRETAPATSSNELYLDAKGDIRKGLSEKGPLAVATPGFVAGLEQTHKRFGKLAWNQLVGPAIKLANDGFPVYPALAERIQIRREKIMADPGLQALLYPRGVALQTGDTLRQPDLGKTLALISKGGARGFYQGEIAQAIAKTLKGHADTAKLKAGFITTADLKEYEANGVKFRAPLTGNYRGYSIVTAPPPSAGGVVFLQSLNVLAGIDLSKEVSYSRYIHLLTETLKRGFADRSAWIGDPDHFKSMEYKRLLTPAHADSTRAKIQLDKATPSKDIRPAPFDGKDGGTNTTHFSLIDSNGNAVSSTITINDNFGAGMTVPGTGIILNNEMDDFNPKAGAANIYGATAGASNRVEPKKRPTSSMMPTILLQNGRPILSVGAAGGPQIISTVLSITLNYLSTYRGDVRRAVFAPRFHHQWTPDKLIGEWKGIPPLTQDRLKTMGHTLEIPIFALAQAVSADWTTGRLTAVFDPRDEGGAEGR